MKLLTIMNDFYHSKMQCVSISFSTSNGDLEVLKGHADSFLKLTQGIVEITAYDNSKVRYFVRDGLISFLDQENATLLSDSLELLKD